MAIRCGPDDLDMGIRKSLASINWKNKANFPKTKTAMSEYVDFMFLKQGLTPWSRILIGHNKTSDILDNESFREYLGMNDMVCYKEKLQVKKTCRVGWLLGSLPKSFNTKEFEEGISTMKEMKNFPI